MKYLVNTTCQFRNRLYEAGEVVELPAEVEAPPYFDAVSEIDKPTADDASPLNVDVVTEKKGRKE